MTASLPFVGYFVGAGMKEESFAFLIEDLAYIPAAVQGAIRYGDRLVAHLPAVGQRKIGQVSPAWGGSRGAKVGW